MTRVTTPPTHPAATPATTPTPTAATPVGEAATAGPGRPKSDKVLFRTEGSDLLAEWPANFDAKIHKPLQQSDFSAEDVFLIHKAEFYDSKAAECRSKAAIFTQFGSAEARKAAEKYQKMLAKMAELQAELTANGVDPNTIQVPVATPVA